MADMNNPVEAGIEMARRAIEFDSAHAYPEALQYYRRAAALLNQALQSTASTFFMPSQRLLYFFFG
jgi:hypothetical protein